MTMTNYDGIWFVRLTQQSTVKATLSSLAFAILLMQNVAVIRRMRSHARRAYGQPDRRGNGHEAIDAQPLEQMGLGLALSVLSSGLNGLLAWVMFKAAHEHRSIALRGDARHLVTDVWTSIGVVVGLVAVHFTGWLWLDPVVAIGVALNILREGAHLVWTSSQALMDEAVEPAVREQIEEVLKGFD